MANADGTVYAICVEITNEEDWNKFISITDWFDDDAPIDDLKKQVLSHPGWCHFLDVDYMNMFQFSPEWTGLRDSGLAVCVKHCKKIVDGYVSPNSAYSKYRG